MKDVKEKSGELQGFNYVLPAMIEGLEGSSNKRLLGETPEIRAMVQQWLQYAITLRESCPVSSDLLKEIDGFLASSTFLVGHNLTVADPVMYLSLHPTYVSYLHAFTSYRNSQHKSCMFSCVCSTGGSQLLREGKVSSFIQVVQIAATGERIAKRKDHHVQQGVFV